MSHKLRSVNTKFWQDPFIESLKPIEKLIFIYLLTNSLTTLIGVYEISIKRISYDTGVSEKEIEEILYKFSDKKKIHFIDNYIIISNWMKNQKLNENMRISAQREIDKLPNNLKIILLNHSEPLPNHSEPLPNHSEPLNFSEKKVLQDEVEDEVKDEVKDEVLSGKNFFPPCAKKIEVDSLPLEEKKAISKTQKATKAKKETPPQVAPDPPALKPRAKRQFTKPTIEQVQAYCAERKNSVNPKKFFNYYESNGWKVGKNPMVCWKAAVRTWENNGIVTTKTTTNANNTSGNTTISEGKKSYKWDGWKPSRKVENA